MNYTVKLLEWPGDKEWYEVKRRALRTVGLTPKTPPDAEWKHAILEARHSPIRFLRFCFDLQDVPYWVAMHLRTHVHNCPNGDEFALYIYSQRDDRQDKYERGKAPQDMPVNLMLDMSAEQLMNFANKRLCRLAAEETRQVVHSMCKLVSAVCPEFDGLLTPMCVYHGGVCHETKPCGRAGEE